MMCVLVTIIPSCRKAESILSGTEWANSSDEIHWIFVDDKNLLLRQIGYYEVDVVKKELFLNGNKNFTTVIPYNYSIEKNKISLYLLDSFGNIMEESNWNLLYVEGEDVFNKGSVSGTYKFADNTETEIHFFKDGYYHIDSIVKYSVKRDTIIVGNEKYKYSIDGNELHLVAGESFYLQLMMK